MKKILFVTAAVLLVLSVLGGCSKQQAESLIPIEPSASPAEPAPPTVETDPIEPVQTPSVETDPIEPTQTPAVETDPAETESDTESEEDVSSDPVETAYAQQIERYYTAISERWDESTYFDHEMSALAAYYYEGNAPDNVGFTFMDLDGDDVQELIIGAIKNSERDPLVFEIWTLKNGEPEMLAQSGSRNRYYMQYAEEDGMWSVAYEAENGAANYAVYYLRLSDGKFEVIQGVVFDAMTNENDPWFMAYDLDWDVSNDMPIDEDLANAVMSAARNIYTAVEYLPYSQYK